MPAFALLEHELLQSLVSRAEPDSQWTILAAHAVPERLVAIESDDFVAIGARAWSLRAIMVPSAAKNSGVYGTWPSSSACGSS